MKLNFEIPESVLKKYPHIAQAWEEEKAAQAEISTEKKKLEISDNLAKEMREVGLLLDEPDQFTCPTIIRSWFGKKYDYWSIHYLPFDTLVRLGREYAEIEWSEEELSAHGIIEAKRMTLAHARRLAKITAIAWCGENPFLSLLRPLMTWYFAKRMTPSMFLNVVEILNRQGDYANFSHSIRLTRGKRLTEPALIENAKEG